MENGFRLEAEAVMPCFMAAPPPQRNVVRRWGLYALSIQALC
ncbi:hypothetical protein APS_0294 [Acetobacter pasteurianus subsp. pasteurianus LMG 1262 = NBRC 106471]|nr:hypothetical protein APS_0294 [Acetobacter pasteurianus subsp. pasteurianus LMG 1262 = NBRC 106471]